MDDWCRLDINDPADFRRRDSRAMERGIGANMGIYDLPPTIAGFEESKLFHPKVRLMRRSLSAHRAAEPLKHGSF